MIISTRLFSLVAVFVSLSFLSVAQVRLPALIGDGMVLQRDRKISIWGWATAGEKLRVSFAGKKYKTVADGQGDWKVEMVPIKEGGPYTLIIDGANHIEVKDILVGDVWFCSGQSNMVLPMERVKEKYPAEIASANYPEIRNYFVPTASDVEAVHKDLPAGKWLATDPKSVMGFGAASYFFARNLYEKYHVPIGIINSSVGGTPIQAWISEEGIRSLPVYANRLSQFKDTAYMDKIHRAGRAPIAGAPRLDPREDKGLNGSLHWYDTSYVPSGWSPFWMPGYWADQGVRGLNGVVWFRKEFDVPASMTNQPAKLFVGRIVDADQTYVNGQLVGGITYQYPPRRYELPANLLKPGKNILVVRVTNTAGKGGFVPDKPYYLLAGGQKIDLRGDWQYKVGEVLPPFRRDPNMAPAGPPFSAQNEPTGLYNTMVAPAVSYGIKGFVWYQGEANTGHPSDYYALMRALITDWRDKWKEGELPFLYVQLPNFQEVQYSPSESGWAELREAQLNALSVPNTAMAVTIDVGEWNDIHPLNKKVVGDRLALAAEKLAYGEKEIVASGPLFQSSRIEGDRIVVRFQDTGSGLEAKGGGELASFAIAGSDKRFVWADAKIEGDHVIVSSPEVPRPMYVRYAWADNPASANLYNKEGLPASPFETGDSNLRAGSYKLQAASYKPDAGKQGPPVWNNKQCAVVLTYDDAIDADLDRVIPALDSVGLRGTFYIIGSSPVLAKRMDEWRKAAAEGHELGNHALVHPCDGSLPGRGFVTPDNDLSKYSVSRAVTEIRLNNILLRAIDGKDERTFAYPCGDLKIGDAYFYNGLRKDFVGARGVAGGLQSAAQVNLDNIDSYYIADQPASYMIDLVKKAEQSHTLLVFLFHGVGGGHAINEGQAEHSALLHYLKEHEADIWIAPMVDVARNIRDYQRKQGVGPATPTGE
jgi:sialate O-acetylesterase